MKCPICKEVTDNGNDREYPPNPYVCTKCESTSHSALEVDSTNRSSTPSFYIASIDETNGEYTYNNLIKFSVLNTDTLDSVLEQILVSWYATPCTQEDSGYYFNGREVFCTKGKCIEVSKEVFDALPIIPEFDAITLM